VGAVVIYPPVELRVSSWRKGKKGRERASSGGRVRGAGARSVCAERVRGCESISGRAETGTCSERTRKHQRERALEKAVSRAEWARKH